MSACVTANSCASSTEVRLTFVPETDAERRVRARELRAEARAWRRAAELVDRDPFSVVAETDAMENRMFYHWDKPETWWTSRQWWQGGGRVLACLFLALECEDEARALGRGGR